MKTLKTFKLIRNWGYDVNPNDENPESDGHFALGLICKKNQTITSKLTDRKDYIEQFGYGTFYKCREVFHKVFTEKDKSILYVHEGNLSDNIAEFINKIEDILFFPKKDQSQFFKAKQRTTITGIRPAKFWLVCPMRRQLFSLLLRSGRNHVLGYPIIVALQNSKYTKETFPAINLFLEGYTKFHQKTLDILAADHHKGFVFSFSGKSEEQIKDILLFKP
jgi:hypothetical protein